jgi:hypothetical protein
MKAMANKCHFRKKDGKICGADAQSEKEVCIFHDPARAADGRRARRAGGASRSQTATVLPLETPDNPLRNTHEVVSLLSESINHLRRGQLDPRVANAVGYLSGILLKALEQGRTEERLSHLEAVLGCNKSTGAEAFHFIPSKECTREQPSTATEDD